jgi:hypothetical protein
MRANKIMNHELILQVPGEPNWRAPRNRGRAPHRRVRQLPEHKLVAQWLRAQSVLCNVHRTKLRQGLSLVLASTIVAVVERHRNRLIEDPTHLRDEYEPGPPWWGLLGREAEFLVSQRGLHG